VEERSGPVRLREKGMLSTNNRNTSFAVKKRSGLSPKAAAKRARSGGGQLLKAVM